jgi:hypothetical protein
VSSWSSRSVSAAILVWEGLFLIVIAAVAGLALIVVLDNVRELALGLGWFRCGIRATGGGRRRTPPVQRPEIWMADQA